MEETGCEVICGAPMTLAVKGKGRRGFKAHMNLSRFLLSHIYTHWTNTFLRRLVPLKKDEMNSVTLAYLFH